jgi:hypothetical protein
LIAEASTAAGNRTFGLGFLRSEWTDLVDAWQLKTWDAYFSGRESDAPLGIWGSIATQLDKKEQFADYYSPLSAPGQTLG